MKRTAIASVLFAATSAVAAAPTIQAEKSAKYGEYLTDAQGRALYLFEPDKKGESTCYDACAKAWPPLMAQSQPQTGQQVDKSKVGKIERKGGGEQVTYNGWPLYYFVKDAGPGETKGQDVKGFGGEWYLVTPEGMRVRAK